MLLGCPASMTSIRRRARPSTSGTQTGGTATNDDAVPITHAASIAEQRPGGNHPCQTGKMTGEAVDARVRRRLRELRTASGLSLQQVADRAAIDVSTLSRLETGKRRLALDHPALAAAPESAPTSCSAPPRLPTHASAADPAHTMG